MQERIHALTNARMQRPSLVMLCPCGDLQNKWVPSPAEDTEGQTEAPLGGLLTPAARG